TERENPAEVLPKVAHLVGHIQIADAPGRAEPGTGQIDWPAMLKLIESVGYTGALGLELTPSTSDTAAALTHIRALAA
ncbi:MAG: TIM barrel protein, partial [Pseudomonadota bacterium]